MADDFFPMSGPSEPAGGGNPPETPTKAAPKEENEMDGQTALLPKSVLGGKDFQPGDEVVLKIVRVHDGEVEVSSAAETTKQEPTANEEIDEMAAGKSQGMPEDLQEGY